MQTWYGVKQRNFDSREILLFHQNSAHADAILFVDLINETNLPDRNERNE